MLNTIDILGVLVDVVTMDEAVSRAKSYIAEDKAHTVFTPNSEIIYAAYKDADFCQTLNTADMIIADGIGVVYASKILKAPLPERVAGFDLSCRLLEEANKEGYSVYFFGGKPGVAEMAIEKLIAQYPALKVAGYADGYFDADVKIVAEELAELIKKSIPEYLYGEWKFANVLANLPVLDAVVECLIEKGVLTPPENGIGAEGCWVSVQK